MSDIKLIHGDCLEKMKDIPDKSIDMILCDLPYGTTSCKWDVVIPFNKYILSSKNKVVYQNQFILEEMKNGLSYQDSLQKFNKLAKDGLWEQYKRIIKDRGAIVLFGSEPFSSCLRMSNIRGYKYDWVWVKNRVSNYLNAKKQPLRSYETVSVFYEKQCRYNPIPFSNEVYSNRSSKLVERGTANYGDHTIQLSTETRQITSAKNVLYFDTVHPNSREYIGHPTQKPVPLLEYLIKTYTIEGETVLDNCAGSFTTAVACDNTNRNWICIEKEEKYCSIGLTRINDNRERLSLPLLNSINSRGDLIGEDD